MSISKIKDYKYRAHRIKETEECIYRLRKSILSMQREIEWIDSTREECEKQNLESMEETKMLFSDLIKSDQRRLDSFLDYLKMQTETSKYLQELSRILSDDTQDSKVWQELLVALQYL